MIVGIGTDLIETRRVERELNKGEWLSSDGIFTSGEIEQCDAALRPALRYAACFAAKEATLKALGMAVNDLGMFREVELHFDARGQHSIELHRRLQSECERLGVERIKVSIATTALHIGAIVLLER